jgi:hypothetical protein
MRKILGILAILACAGIAMTKAFGTTETVTGEVISLSCYFQNHANIGQAGLLCAQATVRYEGNPVGLLASNGKVYQLAGGLVAGDNARMVPFLGHTVSITGDVLETRGHMLMLTADAATLVK